MSILVVDDEMEIADLIEIYLKNEGYQVYKYYNGNDVLKEIDEEYDLLADNADETTISKSKKELSRMESILGNDQTIDSLVKDIINHYENNRENLLTGKAMVVAYSRDIAVKIYKRMLELRPDWKSKVKIVMTGSNKDPE